MLKGAEDVKVVAEWTAAIVVAILAAFVSRGTSFHRLAFAAAASLVLLFVLLSLSEALFRWARALATKRSG